MMPVIQKKVKVVFCLVLLFFFKNIRATLAIPIQPSLDFVGYKIAMFLICHVTALFFFT